MRVYILIFCFSILLLGVTSAFSQDFGCYSAPSSTSSFSLKAFSGHDSKMGLEYLELPSSTPDGSFVRHYPAPPTGIKIVRDSGEVVNGKKTGRWFEFNKNGKWVHTGQYLRGHRQGTWKSYWTQKGDSILNETYDYSDGRLEGQVKKFFKGDLWQICNFRNGLLQGICIDYNDLDRSKLELVSYYDKGVLVDSMIEFNSNGDKSYVKNYRNGKLNGQTRGYNENGQLKILATYENDSLSGLYKKYHENGQLFYKLLFKNDLPYCCLTGFDSLGNGLDMGSLSSGTGTLNSFYENGQLRSSATYDKQLLNGDFTMLYENGSLHEKGVIYSIQKANFNRPPYRLWIEDLNLYTAIKQSFGNDTKYTIYSDSGKVISQIGTVNNTDSSHFVGRKFYSREGGENIEISMTLMGRLIGKYELRFKDGQIKLVGNYKHSYHEEQMNTFKDGLFVSYYPNGQIQSAINYDMGEEVDSSLYYDEEGNLIRIKIIRKDGGELNIFNGDTINVIDKNGLKQGKWLSFPNKYDFSDCTTEPNYIRYYKDDFPFGNWTSYSASGRVLESYEWIDSSFALCTRFYFKDFPLSKGYVDREFNDCGNWQIFDSKSGKLIAEGQMVYGRRQGLWKYYRKNGKVKKTVRFELGEEL